MTPLLISQAHFFYFCNTCLFLKLRSSSYVARRNIFLLCSGICSKSIRYSTISTKLSSRKQSASNSDYSGSKRGDCDNRRPRYLLTNLSSEYKAVRWCPEVAGARAAPDAGDPSVGPSGRRPQFRPFIYRGTTRPSVFFMRNARHPPLGRFNIRSPTF